MSTSDYWRRFSRQRLSRRRVLAAGAAGMGAAALGLAGCSGNKDEEGKTPVAGTPVSETPKTGGVSRQGGTTPVLKIDPHTETQAGLAFLPYIYGYLAHYVQPPEGAPQTIWDHATALEQPEETVFNFKMRPGVRFQDVPPVSGREVTVEDVIYSLDRIVEVGPEPFWKKYIANKSAPDPSTFRLELSSVYAYTMEDVGGVRCAIVPREAAEAWGNLEQNGIGSGPFGVKSFSRGDSLELARNPNYYVAGIPHLDGISYLTIADDASVRAAFRAKQLDTYAPPSKIIADEVAAYGGDVVMIREPNLLVYKVDVNELSRQELRDIRVREAIDKALDRDTMIEKLTFGEGNYTGPVSWGLSFWSLPQEELRAFYKRDVTKAKQLLEAAGVSDLSLELKFNSAQTFIADIGAMVKEHLAEVGINVTLVPQEVGTYLADRSNVNYQLGCGGGLPYPSERYPLQFNHTYNWTREAPPIIEEDPAVDAMLDKILATPDVDERQKLVLEATRAILNRHGPFLYLFAPYAYTARWSYLKGYENVPSAMTGITYTMWLDK